MLNKVKDWFSGGEPVSAAKDRIASLRERGATEKLGRKDEKSLKASEEIVNRSRRNFLIKVGATLGVAVSATLGTLELVKRRESDKRRRKISEASIPKIRINPTEESLNDFIPKFEMAFEKMADDLITTGKLSQKMGSKVSQLKSLVAKNADQDKDGRNYKTHKRNRVNNMENSLSPNFYYNVEADHISSGYAAYAAMQRFVQFDKEFNCENTFDMMVSMHEINHVEQDIKSRQKLTSPGRLADSYVDRYTLRPGKATNVNIDDENDSYSLQVEILNAQLGGLLKEASQNGDLEKVEALSNDYIRNRPQNFSKQQDVTDYIIDLYEYILENVKNSDLIEKMRIKSQAISAEHISIFINLLVFSSHHFNNESKTRDYLKKFYRDKNLMMFENDPNGMFRTVD